ncbi:hypothetical protein Tco_1071759 [Tanacetum coccineum]
MAAEKADDLRTIVKSGFTDDDYRKMTLITTYQASTSMSKWTVEQNGSSLCTTCSTEVHQAAETVTTSNELDLLFGPLFDEYFNGENQGVLKSSAVTTTDASNKRQQQPDSTSSTSSPTTTVHSNGNFVIVIF